MNDPANETHISTQESMPKEPALNFADWHSHGN